MTIFIAVVSHGHGELISKLDCLSVLNEKFKLVVKSNRSDSPLEQYCQLHGITLLSQPRNCGFGENNNIIFNYCKDELGLEEDDYFIVLNPDISISNSTLSSLINKMQMDSSELSCINLYKDRAFIEPDNSIRRFPVLSTFIKSYLGMGNDTILNKATITSPITVDWAAGSFLAFKAGLYRELKGFDEGYFMYCEDIDICYRSAKNKQMLTYYPQFKAQHLAKHANRKFLSKHLYWHIKSAFRFLLVKQGLISKK